MRKFRKSLVVIFVILSVIFFALGLFIIPKFTVGEADYRIIVTSKGAVSDVVFWIQTPANAFNSSSLYIVNKTKNAQYVRTVTPFKDALNNSYVNLFLTINRLEPKSLLNTSFQLKYLKDDPNINDTFVLIPTLQGSGSQVDEISVRLTIRSTLGILLYSYANSASVNGGKLAWSQYPEEKNLTLQSLRLTVALGSLLLAGIAMFPFKIRLSKLPFVTLCFSVLILSIYSLFGTASDISFDYGVAPILIALLNPLLHESFGHLAGNIFFGFIFSGSVIEIGLSKTIGRMSYTIFLGGYLLTVAFTFISGPSVGASLWIISLSFIIFEYLRRRKILRRKIGLLATLLAGYAILLGTYNYAANYLLYYYYSASASNTLRHLWFLFFTAIIVMPIFEIRDKDSLTRRFVRTMSLRTRSSH